ncbi:MAG: GLPGLI family protein [Flavobacteriaceae bacterium]|nr:GLPGLI family protein [Flavobacteriaceae bacterium]
MKKIILIILTFSFLTISAQDFQGKAFYKTKRKMSISMDSTQVGAEQQKMINEMLKKQSEKEFELIFDKEQSVYREQESLGGIQQGGIEIIMAGGADILYRNTKEERYVNQNELFGKPFLIKDKAKKQEWKLESETKKIGNYTCYKATTTREVKKFQSISINGEEEEKEPEVKTITITAWYTSQIPVAHGPSNYWGLPGLILEVNDGSQVMICNKIILNPKEKLSINEPKKGKVVTQEEYRKIMEKKMKEMNKSFKSGRKKGNGHSIKIGG